MTTIRVIGYVLEVTEPKVVRVAPYRFYGVCPCGWHSDCFGTGSAASKRLRPHEAVCRTAMALAWQKAHATGEREGVAS